MIYSNPSKGKWSVVLFFPTASGIGVGFRVGSEGRGIEEGFSLQSIFLVLEEPPRSVGNLIRVFPTGGWVRGVLAMA